MTTPTSKETNLNTQPRAKCKVCFDAGLDASKYNSHFLRNKSGPNGVIICPTLLSQKCRKCDKLGHTSSYCVVVDVKLPVIKETKKQSPVSEGKTFTNKFEFLNEERKEEKNVKKEEKEKEDLWPGLSSNKKRVQGQEVKPGLLYSAIAAKLPVIEEKLDVVFTPKIVVRPVVKSHEPVLLNWNIGYDKNNWAGCNSDSDDEENEGINYDNKWR